MANFDYPYTDFHEINLDWVIAQIRKLHNDWNDFKVLNAITYAGTWNITKSYKLWSFVDDGNGMGYISIKPVPAGILLDNEDYWRLVANYSAIFADFQNRLIAVEKSKYWINVKDFGAIGDGIHDDTDAFKESFNQTIKRVHIPDGIYLLSDTIVIPDDYIVTCDGIILSNTQYVPKVEIGNNCDIQINIDEDMETSSSIYDQNSAVLHLDNKNHVRIHDSKLINIGSRWGIECYKGSDIIIENCYVDKYIYGGIVCNKNTNNFKVLNCTVLHGHGIEVNRYPIGCVGNTNNAEKATNVIISHNYVEDDEPGWEGIDSHGVDNCVIDSNVIKNTLTGIAVVKGSSSVISNNVVISNNTFIFDKTGAYENRNTFGIVVECHTQSKNINICNNSIMNTGDNISTTSKGGFYITGPVKTSNNCIRINTGTGIYMTSNLSSNGVAIDFMINDNIIENIGAAVSGCLFKNTALTDIIGVCKNNTIVNFTNAIEGNTNYGSGSSYLPSVYCKDNTFIDCINEIINNIRGTFLDHGASASNYMRAGQIIYNTSNTSTHFWLCVTSATSMGPSVNIAR